jgi:hypothetical protein
VTVDALVTEVLVSHVLMAEPNQGPELVEGNGIPVLRTGQPLDPAIVNDTLEMIHRERDLWVLGQRCVSIFLETAVLLRGKLVVCREEQAW